MSMVSLTPGARFAPGRWCRRSGMSARAWCRAERISYSTFMAWRTRLVR
jgi:hypothetical protein